MMPNQNRTELPTRLLWAVPSSSSCVRLYSDPGRLVYAIVCDRCNTRYVHLGLVLHAFGVALSSVLLGELGRLA